MTAYLYLIRHPHTQIDLDKPAGVWNLSDQGRAQVEALVRASFWQRVSAIYPSSERKTVYPAERAAARYGLPVNPTPAFGEVDRRAYTAPDPASYTAAVADFLAHPDSSPRGWETASAALARFRAGLADVLARHGAGESVAVISHGLILTVFMASLRGEPASLDRWKALGFCTAAALDRAALRPLTDFLPAPYTGLPE